MTASFAIVENFISNSKKAKKRQNESKNDEITNIIWISKKRVCVNAFDITTNTQCVWVCVCELRMNETPIRSKGTGRLAFEQKIDRSKGNFSTKKKMMMKKKISDGPAYRRHASAVNVLNKMKRNHHHQDSK